MPDIAKHIEIRTGEAVLVDGEEFPYYVADRAINVEADARSGVHIVNLPILAESFSVIQGASA